MNTRELGRGPESKKLNFVADQCDGSTGNCSSRLCNTGNYLGIPSYRVTAGSYSAYAAAIYDHFYGRQYAFNLDCRLLDSKSGEEILYPSKPDTNDNKPFTGG